MSSPLPSSRKQLHICPQDPRDLFGGLGVAALTIARQHLSQGNQVVWMCIGAGRRPGEEWITYPEGQLKIKRITVSDSDSIESYNDGSNESRFRRREDFYRVSGSN